MKALARSAKKAVSHLAELEVKGQDLNARLSDIVRASLEAAYRFDDYKSKKGNGEGLAQLVLAVPDKAAVSAGKKAVAWGQAVAAGVNRARTLDRTPRLSWRGSRKEWAHRAEGSGTPLSPPH